MKPKTLLKICLLPLLCVAINARSQTISGIVNSYYQVTAINTSTNSITVSNATGLTAKTRVLLIQMKGASIDNSNSSSYGNITAINNAGNYEMNTVCSVTGNEVALEFQMLNSYTVTEPVQLVSVPSYSSVTITDSVKSTPWDPTTGTGGIVAIEASSTITLNSGIDVSGQGFIGGSLFNYSTALGYNCNFTPVAAYYYPNPPTDAYKNAGTKGEGIADYITNEECGMGKLANGGGGGNNQNTGGGGGSNYGSGGKGGNSTALCYAISPGIGGLSLSSYGYSTSSGANRIFFGGGGGSGHENNAVGTPGGNGGGIVLLSAPTIISSGMSILANGGRPYNAALADPYQASGDGGGGGGGGGTVLINGTISGTINILANGADGSNASYPPASRCGGPGGGGGGGVVWVTGSSFPVAITASVNGGQNGVGNSLNATCSGNAQGATAGTNGNTQPNYALPQSATKICTPLPIPGLQYFTGSLTNDGANLTWLMNSIDEVSSYQLQSTIDKSDYATIATIKNNGQLKLNYNDYRIIDGTVYYRLMMTKTDGSTYYSEIVPLTRNPNGSLQSISLRPNPATDNITIVLYAKQSSHADMIIYNSYGQKIAYSSNQISAGYNKINISLSSLSSGIYYLKITGADIASIKSFIKR